MGAPSKRGTSSRLEVYNRVGMTPGGKHELKYRNRMGKLTFRVARADQPKGHAMAKQDFLLRHRLQL